MAGSSGATPGAITPVTPAGSTADSEVCTPFLSRTGSSTNAKVTRCQGRSHQERSHLLVACWPGDRSETHYTPWGLTLESSLLPQPHNHANSQLKPKEEEGKKPAISDLKGDQSLSVSATDWLWSSLRTDEKVPERLLLWSECLGFNLCCHQALCQETGPKDPETLNWESVSAPGSLVHHELVLGVPGTPCVHQGWSP